MADSIDVRVPFRPTVAARGMVCAADRLAATAGVELLGRGGTAGDAAVGAAAVMAVVGPHLCGMGGDLLAVVKPPDGPPVGLLAAGRAGSGADPDRLRAEGHTDIPYRGDVRSVTVPGAVDGWLALHERFGRLPLVDVMAPARSLATEGFAASLLLSLASNLVAGVPGVSELCPNGPRAAGELVRLPGIARTLDALAREGRAGVYGGELGGALLDLGAGEYRPEDLAVPLAEWVEPVSVRAMGHDLWSVPAPSQGYLTLAGAWIAEQVGLPTDPADPRWPHLIVESARAAGWDRPAVLYDGAQVTALVETERLASRGAGIDVAAASAQFRSDGASEGGVRGVDALSADGDTTHLCAVDGAGLGISLTQSNALDFGSHLVAGETGVFLHNRGVGFCLEPGHPDEYGPHRRPAHTLSPALVTRPDGSLSHVIGTMGGDSQPQILLQLLARLLVAGEDPATAMASARVVLEAPGRPPFRLWGAPPLSLVLEQHAPPLWLDGLESRGHSARVVGAFNPVDVGCAQVIGVTQRADGSVSCSGASDPRSPEGAALGR